jgi:hypothetical protein
MGLVDTIKGWFNIGGVSVKLKDVNPLISKSKNTITGKAILTTGGDKTVLKMEYTFVLKKTTGSGDEKKTDEFVIGYTEVAEPFEIKKGETKTLDFAINYALEKTLADMGAFSARSARWPTGCRRTSWSTSSSASATSRVPPSTRTPNSR